MGIPGRPKTGGRGTEPAGTHGDEVTALALTVLACPTIVPTDDGAAQTDGAENPPVDFDYTVTDSGGFTQTLADAEFVSAKPGETDIDRDAKGVGKTTADVCLDSSHYMFNDLAPAMSRSSSPAPRPAGSSAPCC